MKKKRNVPYLLLMVFLVLLLALGVLLLVLGIRQGPTPYAQLFSTSV